MAHVFHPPTPAPNTNRPSIFLGGSIDMGKAIDWQAQVIESLHDVSVDLYNPRRPDWDATWEQSFHHQGFRGQVEWELDHLDRATLAFFYFDPKGLSPITLMELGLHARSGKVIVCSPPGFWRRGNVEIVCLRHHIPFFEDFDLALNALRSRL